MKRGRLSSSDRARLTALLANIDEASTTLVGYPCNGSFDYSELFPFLAYCSNNVGDPFADSNFRQNTHEIEREVLLEFARLTGGRESERWGYVTSGGTEGNLYGLYLARELFPDGVVYFSEETHYSVTKSLRLLAVRGQMVRSQASGEIDYQDLRAQIRCHRHLPVIFVANVGTTMKGASDDLLRVRRICAELGARQLYVHCDAALSGMILPFVREAAPWGFGADADSLSMSGHKMLGSPVPCGVVLARKAHVDRIARSVEYVGIRDATLTGSRSAFAPLVLWYALRSLGSGGLERLVRASLQMAAYATTALQKRGVGAWRHEASITVVFPRPSERVVKKWQLACSGSTAHLITMPHVRREMIDAFVEDYLKQDTVAAPFPGIARALTGRRHRRAARRRVS